MDPPARGARLPCWYDAGCRCSQSTKNLWNPEVFAQQLQGRACFVPAGTASLLQPVDVVFNALLKTAIDTMANNHLQKNLEDYTRGKISASERILFTKWVGQAWEDISAKKNMIIRSFKKCGISVAIDGSEDAEMSIVGLEDYVVGDNEDEAPCTDYNGDPFED